MKDTVIWEQRFHTLHVEKDIDMANFNANLLTTVIPNIHSLVKWAESHDGTFSENSRDVWIAQTLKANTSDCPYYRNPGFVCPLSAYREPSLFFVQG